MGVNVAVGRWAVWGLLLSCVVVAAVVDSGEVKPHSRKGRVVYMYHLHKCGGTSFCNDAKAQETLTSRNSNCNWLGDGVVRRRGPGGLFNMDLSCERRMMLMGKEVTYFQTESILNHKLLDCPEQILPSVQFRKPMSRLISHVRFDSGFRRDGLAKFRLETFSTDITDDVRYGTAVMNNFYIRSLLGEDVFRMPLDAITRDHLEEAKKILHKMVVFILENKETRNKLRSCYFDWPAPEPAKSGTHVNKLGGSVDTWIERNVDAEWFAEMRRLNALDMELYAYAVDLSARQAAACDASS